jgi:16S rRNA processing protein RimM
MNSQLNIQLSGFHRVGWVKSAHGISGELYIQLYADNPDWEDTAERLYLLPKNQTSASNPVDKFIELDEFKIKPHKDGVILRTPLIKDRNRAEELKGATVYVTEDALVAEEEDQIFLHELLGFSVLDKGGKVLGNVEDFSTNGMQDLLVVKLWNSKSALIPLVEAYLVEIDYEAKTMQMDLPPGLLDLDGPE